MDMKRSYQTQAQRKSEEEKKREKLEKYENAADDYKRGKFANIRKAAMAYDLNYNTLYKVCYSYPWSYMQKTSSVAETAIWAKKIGGKFGLKMA